MAMCIRNGFKDLQPWFPGFFPAYLHICHLCTNFSFGVACNTSSCINLRLVGQMMANHCLWVVEQPRQSPLSSHRRFSWFIHNVAHVAQKQFKLFNFEIRHILSWSMYSNTYMLFFSGASGQTQCFRTFVGQFRRSQILNAVQGTCSASSAPVRTRLWKDKNPLRIHSAWYWCSVRRFFGHPCLSRDLLAACWSLLAHPRC